MKALLIVLTLALFAAVTAFPAIAAPELSLDSAEVLQGQSAVLNLSISGGTEVYAGVNAKIRLPQGVTVSSVSKGTVLASGFTADWYASGSDVAVIAYSTSSTFSSAGVLFTLNIQAGYSTPAGDNTIAFVSDTSGLINLNALSNADGSKSIVPTVKNGVLTVLADTDKDGLWDDWEKKYFGNLDQKADGDPDNDGLTNIEEYRNGTDPKQTTAIVPGDVDGNGYVTLKDAVLAMKVVSGQKADGVKIGADIGNKAGEKKIGVEEVIFILKKLAGK
jgi:hypothetical protein